MAIINQLHKLKTIPLILASGSPRRQELLTQAGFSFIVMPANIDEQVFVDELPIDYIKRMVQQKAEQSIAQLQANPSIFNIGENAHSFAILLTADTIGVLPTTQKILTKPENQDDAFSMWQQMSGAKHQIYTAVQICVLHSQKDRSGIYVNSIWQKQLLESTDVHFIQLTHQDMQQYWDTGEPLDKAGGYAIQGKGMAWVLHIDGSYSNVVGLPLPQTIDLINESYQWIMNSQMV